MDKLKITQYDMDEKMINLSEKLNSQMTLSLTGLTTESAYCQNMLSPNGIIFKCHYHINSLRQTIYLKNDDAVSPLPKRNH